MVASLGVHWYRGASHDTRVPQQFISQSRSTARGIIRELLEAPLQ
jgi:hypothetical protein